MRRRFAFSKVTRDDPRAYAAAEAQAAVEDDDIEQMIEARDERRRRAGRESIGNELAREALRRPPD